MRVGATPQAETVVAQVRAAHPGDELVFVFGSGCCEGTAPHLFARYTLTPEQESVGAVGGVGVFADAHVRRLYAARTIVIERRRTRSPTASPRRCRSAGGSSAGLPATSA